MKPSHPTYTTHTHFLCLSPLRLSDTTGLPLCFRVRRGLSSPPALTFFRFLFAQQAVYADPPPPPSCGFACSTHIRRVYLFLLSSLLLLCVSFVLGHKPTAIFSSPPPPRESLHLLGWPKPHQQRRCSRAWKSPAVTWMAMTGRPGGPSPLPSIQPKHTTQHTLSFVSCSENYRTR